MDAFQLLEDAGTVPAADDATIEAAVERVRAAAFRESGRSAIAAATVGRRRRLGGRQLVAVAGVAGAVAAALLVLAPGDSAVAPTSAAAAVLVRAAVAAQDQPTLTLGAGQYLYSEISELQTQTWAWGNYDPAEQADTIQPETIQTWVAADGSDRVLTTYTGPQQFTTAASREGWILAGKPPITPQTNTPSGQDDEHDGPGTLTINDLAQLPTDPAALTQLIAEGKTGQNVGWNPNTPITPWYTFQTAAQILATPALGSSPALCAALYQVMADVPGIELLGTTTDRSGRTGTQIAGPLNSADGVRIDVIIDPADGSVLEINYVTAEPSLEPPSYQKYLGDTSTWTDYLTTAVVNSTSSTTPSPTTPNPTATTTTPSTQTQISNSGSTGPS